MSVPVTLDNFVRAETDRMFSALQTDAGGVNIFRHNRVPTPLDSQTVIRMNGTRSTASRLPTSPKARQFRFPTAATATSR